MGRNFKPQRAGVQCRMLAALMGGAGAHAPTSSQLLSIFSPQFTCTPTAWRLALLLMLLATFIVSLLVEVSWLDLRCCPPPGLAPLRRELPPPGQSLLLPISS